MSQDENLAAVVSNAAQDIGSYIRAQREAAQVSVRQLAEKAGVSNPYLSQIERACASRRPTCSIRSPRRCVSPPRCSTYVPGSRAQ